MEQAELDERGRLCPEPIIALAQAAKAAERGDRLVLLTDDPGAKPDVIAWCRMTGATLIDQSEQPDHLRSTIEF